MAFKPYSQIINEQHDKLVKIFQVYIMAAPNEQVLRFMWAFAQATFSGRYAGRLVGLSKFKDKRKQQLGIYGQPEEAEPDIYQPSEEYIQQNSEAHIMENYQESEAN